MSLAKESDDNTWDKVVDQTVTSGTNGLRMPYCDKAQRILKREFVERKQRGEFFTERELMDQHAYLKEEAAWHGAVWGDAADAGKDLPIDEWIRLGRCRHSWRLPLAQGPTLWRPPLRYQWAEPAAPWEDRAQLKGSPVVRRFEGSSEEFRQRWQEAVSDSKLLGRWLCGTKDARWRGGLQEDSTHEDLWGSAVRYILRAQRVVLLLSPEPSAALTFTEFRKVLNGWTKPDDVHCVPICGSPMDSQCSALHTIVKVDGMLGQSLEETTLRSGRGPALRLSGPGANSAMVRNLRLVAAPNAAAVEIHTDGEPAIVGCKLFAEGAWGTCIKAKGGSPMILRNFVSSARWGLVLVNAAGRVEERNNIADCGGPAILAVADCRAVLQSNDVRECLSGVKVMGKHSEIQMRSQAKMAARAFTRLDDLAKEEAAAIAATPLGQRRRQGYVPKKHGAAPARREVLVSGKSWDGPQAGFGEQCVVVEPGLMCEVLRRDRGWLLASRLADLNTIARCVAMEREEGVHGVNPIAVWWSMEIGSYDHSDWLNAWTIRVRRTHHPHRRHERFPRPRPFLHPLGALELGYRCATSNDGYVTNWEPT
eukprot:s868_g25.t1